MNCPDRHPIRAIVLAELLATPAAARFTGDPNRSLLASMIAGQTALTGCLPSHLGLGMETYLEFLADYFPFFDGTARNDLNWKNFSSGVTCRSSFSTTAPANAIPNCGSPTSSPRPAPGATTSGRISAWPIATN